MKKMNSNLIILTLLLVCSGLNGAAARAIDDVDNSIEVANARPSGIHMYPRTRFGTQWLRFTVKPPVKIVQRLGSSVEIPCEVMGSQIPTVQWIVGELPLSEIENIQSNVITEGTNIATVKVNSLHVIEHTLTEPRTYTCVARTGSKAIFAYTVVYPPTTTEGVVQNEEPFTGPAMPRIVYSERMHLELMGSSVVLPCKVLARPKAEVTWSKDNMKVMQNQRFKILPSGDLLISDLRWEDMGTYRCVARNTLGKDEIDVFVYPVKKEN